MKKLTIPALTGLALATLLFAFRPDKFVQPASTASFAPMEGVKWAVDKSHSNVRFSVTHMVVSEVEGNFGDFEGGIEVSKPDLSDAKINFSVNVNSINTGNEMRDKHLRSADFFDAEKFSKMSFVSTSFVPKGGNNYALAGNLTIKDVTKPVTFDVKYNGTITSKQGTKAGFKATATLDRFDYNLKWDRATEAGGLVVSKEVGVVLNLELDKK